MQIIDQAKFNEFKVIQEADPYSARCVSYAIAWADKLETDIASNPGLSVSEVLARYADIRAAEADTDGITGFMHNIACWILSSEWAWVHWCAMRSFKAAKQGS